VVEGHLKKDIQSLRTLVDKDKEVIKLSKRSLLPPFLNLSYSDVIDISIFVFIKGLFIGDKEEGFDRKINNITLTAYLVIEGFVINP
jgi:hypothetical protein